MPPPPDLLEPEAPVDLTNCDREPIHVIGHVQPHGALLVLEEPALRVSQASANAAALLGVGDAVETLLGQPFAEFVGPQQASAVAAAARAAAAEGRAYVPVRITVDVPGGAARLFDAVPHQNDAGLVLELEPAERPRHSAMLTVHGFSATVRRTMAAIAGGTSVRGVAGVVADEVRRLTGFDRVWVYRFHEDWHGEIIAESRADLVPESWLGLHYPASDIPAQARALFERHWLRLIADVQAEPAPLVPTLSPATGAPLELSDCVLRGVSPMHVEYLTNMGVRASMSVSLVRDGVLWGLVSCHHYSGARQVPFDVRAACELLGQAFSTQLGLVERAEERDHVVALGEVRRRLLERMARERDVVEGLVADPELLLALTEAEGAAVCLGDAECALVGRTPGAAAAGALAGWLAERGRDVFHSDALGRVFPPAVEYADVASGVLAVALSRVRPYYVLWFRPQVVQTVAWGGDPSKPVEVAADGTRRLSPRGSFAAWEEEVRGRSRPWRAAEVEAARLLRGTVVDALLARADELAALNRELERSNRELDDFAYVASHDLKEPLRGIHNYAAMVAEDYAGQPLDAAGQARLATVMRLTRRLDGLIDALLEHSRVGRLELERRSIPVQEALDDALDRLAAQVAERGVTVRVPRPLPVVWADRERLVEVFLNLVSNAIKYGPPAGGGEAPAIEVGWLESPPPSAPPEVAERGSEAGPVLYVRDAGIGIAPRHHGTIFRLFKRLHPREAYGGGSGAGLTIVQKVVERHGGRIWLESALGAGTTFYFTLGAEGAAGATTAPAVVGASGEGS